MARLGWFPPDAALLLAAVLAGAWQQWGGLGVMLRHPHTKGGEVGLGPLSPTFKGGKEQSWGCPLTAAFCAQRTTA